jgi:hypothetical protein
MGSGMMSVISGFFAVGTNGSETACLIVLISSFCVRASRQQKHVVVSPGFSC